MTPVPPASHKPHKSRRLDATLPPGAQPSDSGLLGPIEIKAIADVLGIRPTKVLGQNFVHDAGTVRRIVRAADVVATDDVIEVGPGLGSLTLALLETGARVRAVEIDPPLARALPETVRARMPEAVSRFSVVLRDAMTVRSVNDLIPEQLQAEQDASEAKATIAPNKLVANLPYNVAVPVLLSMLEHLPTLTDVLVMVQAEVADRLAAQPGSRTYGVPSVKAAWYGQAERAGTIGRSVFWPVPNVDSALVRLRRNSVPRGDETLRLATFEVCDVAFGQRRKTLRAAMRTWAGSTEAASLLLEKANVDPSVRGETLGIEQFVRIGRALLDLRAKGVIAPTARPGLRGHAHA